MNEEPQEPQQDEAPKQDASPQEPVAPGPPVATETYVERPRLVRRPEGKLLAGVCTGLGAYTGVDPVAWRIGFVVLGLTTGIGIIGYLVAWLVMPMAREGEPVPEIPHRLNAGRWVGIGAIALGALVFAHQVLGFHATWLWGLLLIGLGVALWRRDWGSNGHKPRPPGPGERPMTPPASSPPAGVATTAIVPTQSPPAPPATTAFSAKVTAPIARRDAPATRTETKPLKPLEKRPPSFLGRLVIGACALAIGAAMLLGNLHVAWVRPKLVLAILVGIIGFGLLLGSRWGRAKWLIFPGIVLALVLMTVTAIPFNLRGGAGNAIYTPTSLQTLRRTYEHGAGPLEVDLSHLKFGNRTRTVNAKLGFGPLLVVVPKDVNVIASGHTQAGPLNLFEHGSAGWDVSDQVESRVKGAHGTLRVNANVTFGPLLIERVGSKAISQFKVHGFPKRGGPFETP